MPVARGSSSRRAERMQRKFSISIAVSTSGVARLEPHRHHHVLRLRCRTRADEAAAVGVREAELDLASLDGGQRIQQVVDVEADLELVARVCDLQLFLRLLLLRV